MVILKAIIFIGRRTITLFVIVFLLGRFLVNYDTMGVKTLNRVVPESIDALAKFSEDPLHNNPKILDKYLLYFKTASIVLTKSAAVEGMLGYCYYYLKDYPKAIKHYQKAVAINDSFFWFYHSMGVIYYQQGMYLEASQVLEKALECTPENALIFMNVSRIYRELTLSAEDNGYDSQQAILEGYRQAHELLAKSYFHLKKFPPILLILDNSAKLNLHPKAKTYYYSGLVSLEMKENERAAAFFQQAIKEDSRNTGAYYYLGLSLKNMGHQAEADNFGWQNFAPGEDFDSFGQKEYYVSIF